MDGSQPLNIVATHEVDLIGLYGHEVRRVWPNAAPDVHDRLSLTLAALETITGEHVEVMECEPEQGRIKLFWHQAPQARLWLYACAEPILTMARPHYDAEATFDPEAMQWSTYESFEKIGQGQLVITAQAFKQLRLGD